MAIAQFYHIAINVDPLNSTPAHQKSSLLNSLSQNQVTSRYGTLLVNSHAFGCCIIVSNWYSE